MDQFECLLVYVPFSHLQYSEESWVKPGAHVIHEPWERNRNRIPISASGHVYKSVFTHL